VFDNRACIFAMSPKLLVLLCLSASSMRIAKGPDPCHEQIDRAWHLLKLTPEKYKWEFSGFWFMVVKLREEMAKITPMVHGHAIASSVMSTLKSLMYTAGQLNEMKTPRILKCTGYLKNLIQGVKELPQPITKVIMGIMTRPFEKHPQGQCRATDCSDIVLGVLDNLDDATAITPDLLEEMKQSADDMFNELQSLSKYESYLNAFDNMQLELALPVAVRKGETSEISKQEQNLLEEIAEALDLSLSPPSQVQAQKKTNSTSAQYKFPQVKYFLKYLNKKCYCKHLLFKQAHNRDCTEN